MCQQFTTKRNDLGVGTSITVWTIPNILFAIAPVKSSYNYVIMPYPNF